MKLSTTTYTLYFLIIVSYIKAQEIATHQVIKTDQLYEYLKDDIKKKVTNSEAELATYFRQKFTERFFYDWKTFEDRFETYNTSYHKKITHISRAEDHIGKFTGTTSWVLPFNYRNGEKVNAYALRHLARQHKMVDVGFQYFYDQKDPKYIQYFVDQMHSLNASLEKGTYEKIKDGNGVYEAFRSGYRVLNWLTIHNMFLGENTYTNKNQLITIATLLQHGAHLYKNNAEFKSGNHQTRGVSALAMLAILLRDFKGTEKWYERAMTRLEEHLSKEINPDGFQFERSVHYHMSDIENYFYVYQLAKISHIQVDSVWENKLQSLFTTLAKIAYPDGSAPVLQDDTNIPWGEKNDISGTMTLGYLLFEDPELGYFATDQVDDRMYWFLQTAQLHLLENIKKQTPSYGSLSFPDTGYYIMREGWNNHDKMMIISNGIDDKKPDHQHGDILGIQAIANGQAILPNYQVRYSLKDFELFKNSMVKNVALVDNELQGKQWTSNKGGSGFGKFKKLPKPTTITWKSNNNFDLFVGTHTGFENIGVSYSRQVLYVKDDFWIVKDNFKSDTQHTYKQVWQGHYTQEQGADLVRSTFADASGSDIFQLIPTEISKKNGARGKEWTVINKTGVNNFSFITVIYPYTGYDNRINEEDKNPVLKDWKTNDLSFEATGHQLRSLSKDQRAFLFNVKNISINKLDLTFATETDIFIEIDEKMISVHLLGDKKVEIVMVGSDANTINNQIVKNKGILAPGNIVTCIKK
ncbi:hypothetical protein GCM10022393_03580 [Aquimarina addita]|uniref:Heparinase n=1 Tax=Aquimarina addita TaxID=870485 RepID=A0ABP7X929_9FLAO